MDKKFLKLSDIEAYREAFYLSNYVWSVVKNWDYFSKKTVGEQLVRAVDSISANIAEGFGRYGKRDKIKFYYYSHGSVKEALDWNEKSKIRELINKEEYKYIFDKLIFLPKSINQLIYYTNSKLKN